jgi:hypothetical protein
MKLLSILLLVAFIPNLNSGNADSKLPNIESLTWGTYDYVVTPLGQIDICAGEFTDCTLDEYIHVIPK